jgi:hypothetical protein
MKNYYEFRGYRVRVEYDPESKSFVYQKFVEPALETTGHESGELIAIAKERVQKKEAVTPDASAALSSPDFPVTEVNRGVTQIRGQSEKTPKAAEFRNYSHPA